jgi:hypothetical protein
LSGPDYDWKEADTRYQFEEAKKLKQPNLWGWQYCNEFGYLQNGSPFGQSMFSITVSQDYNNWICELFFGKEYSKNY